MTDAQVEMLSKALHAIADAIENVSVSLDHVVDQMNYAQSPTEEIDNVAKAITAVARAIDDKET